MKRPFLTLFPLLIACATGAQAADPTAAQAAQPEEAAPSTAPEDAATKDADAPKASKKWEISTITYFWAAHIKGETAVSSRVPAVGLDLSFRDILKSFKFGFMGAAQARHDRLVILGDLMWIHIGADRGIRIRDRDFLEANFNSRTTMITGLGGYRAAADGPVIVDIFAGGRLNRTKNDLRLTGPNREVSGDVTETWVDPVVATKVIAPLGGKFSVTLYGDVGGVLFGSDFTGQAIGTLNYDISRKIRLGAGWRYYKVNYSKGGFLYDVAQSGPFIAVATTF